MALYISLVNWTDQGIRSVKDLPARLEGARQLARKYGCEMTHFFMTIGAYDMVVLIEGPNDELVAKFSLALGAGKHPDVDPQGVFRGRYKAIIAGI